VILVIIFFQQFLVARLRNRQAIINRDKPLHSGWRDEKEGPA
jgi:hypothetical protein